MRCCRFWELGFYLDPEHDILFTNSEPQIMSSLSASSAMTAVMLSKFFPMITMTGVIEVNQLLRRSPMRHFINHSDSRAQP